MNLKAKLQRNHRNKKLSLSFETVIPSQLPVSFCNVDSLFLPYKPNYCQSRSYGLNLLKWFCGIQDYSEKIHSQYNRSKNSPRDEGLYSFKIPFVCELGVDINDDLEAVINKARRLIDNGASAIVIEDAYYLEPNPYHDRIVMDTLKFKAFVKGIREMYRDIIVIVKLHDVKNVYVENGSDKGIKNSVLGATTGIKPIRETLQMARTVGSTDAKLIGITNVWRNEAMLMTLPQAIEAYAKLHFAEDEVEEKCDAWKEATLGLTLSQSISVAYQEGFHDFYFNLESTRSELGYYLVHNSVDGLCAKCSVAAPYCDVVLLQDTVVPSLNFVAAIAYNLRKLHPDLVLAYQYPLLEATNIDTDAYFNELSGFVSEFLNMGITWQLLAWQPKASQLIANSAKNHLQRSNFVNGFSNTLYRVRELVKTSNDEENEEGSSPTQIPLVSPKFEETKWPSYYREIVQKLLDEISTNYYTSL